MTTRFPALHVLLVLLAVFLLSGCITTRTVTVTKTRFVVLEPDTSWTTPTKVAKPPFSKAYLEADAETQKDLLVEAWRDQTRQLGMCNNDKKSIRDWAVGQKKKIEAQSSD